MLIKTALITGASSGIGLELARIHAANKNFQGNLVLVARREDRLLGLKKELETKFNVQVQTVSLDLSKAGSARELFNEIKIRNLRIDMLFNNAGIGGLSSFADQDAKLQAQMIQLNMTTPTELMHLFIPEFQKQKSGSILNVASMAAFVPGPYHALYYASKAYLISMSQAIREELKGTGISVTALCPGPTQSEFFTVAHVPLKSPHRLPTAYDVALYGYEKLLEGHALAIPGISNKILYYFLKLFPTSVAIKLSARRLSAFLKNQI